MPVEINNPDEQETIEVSLSEYEAVKVLAAGIAEQNTAIQQQNAVTQEAVKTLADSISTLAASFKELMQGMNIVVNVPEQPAPVVHIAASELPAPVVNVTIPEQPAPVVNVTTPEQKARTVKVKRNKAGYAEGYTIE